MVDGTSHYEAESRITEGSSINSSMSSKISSSVSSMDSASVSPLNSTRIDTSSRTPRTVERNSRSAASEIEDSEHS